MTDTSILLAILGILAVMNAVGLVAVALYVNRQREQVRHCIQIITTLLKAYESETGTKVAVDHGLLGEPLDVVADEDSDVFSKIPDAAPWGVK